MTAGARIYLEQAAGATDREPSSVDLIGGDSYLSRSCLELSAALVKLNGAREENVVLEVHVLMQILLER